MKWTIALVCTLALLAGCRQVIDNLWSGQYNAVALTRSPTPE